MKYGLFLWSTICTLFLFSLSGSSQSNPKGYDKYDTLRGALNPLRSCYDVLFYDLQLRINPADSSIRGLNKIYFSGTELSDRIQIDLFSNWIVDSIVENAQVLRYQRDHNVIFLTFNNTLKVGDQRIISVYYHGHPTVAKKAPWDGGFVWAKDSLGNDWTAVACEGIGASLWWPCKDHLSDEPDSMNLAFEVPQPYLAVSNGRLMKQTKLPDKFSRFQWHVSYPINTYNVSVNVAKYAHFTEMHTQKNGELLELSYYVLPYHLEQAKKHFQQVHRMMDFYEKAFAPYPFEKDSYKLIETPYWGMEHQSGISYGNEFKNDILDWDYIIIHESAHEWWGNNVSVKDHGDMWIHETFATYTEAMLIEASHNYETAIKYLYFQRPRIENKDPIIGPSDVNYNEWEGSDMYYKGAWALHTLRHYINNDSLWYGLFPAIQKKFALQTITSTQLISFINEYFHQDLNWFFKQYFYKKDEPVLQTEWIYKKKKAIVKYKWKNCDEDFKLPVYFADCDQKIFKLIPHKKLSKIVLPKKESCTKFELIDYLYYIDLEEVSELK